MKDKQSYSPGIFVSLIEEWTKKKFETILFDSEIDRWGMNDSTFTQKILNKSNLLIYIDEGEYQFGCYIETEINSIGKWINDSHSFIYSCNPLEKYPIKKSKEAIQISKINEKELMKIGKEDIIIYKKEYFNVSYCKQSSFEYGKKKGVLVGKEGKKNPFIPQRIILFQMK